jgi:hypothetical protein
VDFRQCEQVIVEDPRRWEGCDRLRVFYLTPQGLWVEHLEDEFPTGDPESDPWEWGANFREADPVVVAREILTTFKSQ